MTTIPSPFQPAATAPRRFKALIWGESGAGKTTLALQFPRPVILDLDGGAELYGDSAAFDVRRTTSPDEVMAAVEWLRDNPHDYRTLIIDPMTVYWETLVAKWTDILHRRNAGDKRDKTEYWDMQPKDWILPRREFYRLANIIAELPMNVICTARAKPEYADGQFMRRVGSTFDGARQLPYLFDVEVEILKLGDGERVCRTRKHRSPDPSRILPPEFPAGIETFRAVFGDALEGVAVERATDEQVHRLHDLFAERGFDDVKIAAGLRAHGAATVEDLSAESAARIIAKMQPEKETTTDA